VNHVKKKVNKKGLVVKPIILADWFNWCVGGEYKFILVSQDHLTKYVLLRPLIRKCAEEVVYVLLDIFTTFGVLSMLHSDNGREFAN